MNDLLNDVQELTKPLNMALPVNLYKWMKALIQHNKTWGLKPTSLRDIVIAALWDYLKANAQELQPDRPFVYNKQNALDPDVLDELDGYPAPLAEGSLPPLEAVNRFTVKPRNVPQ